MPAIPNSKFTVEQLSKELGLSKVPLNKKVKALTGNTPKQLLKDFRLKRAAQLLSKGDYQVTDVTYAVGFSDLQHFRESFKTEFGISPSQYIKQNLSE